MARKLKSLLLSSILILGLVSPAWATDYTQDANIIAAWLMDVDEDPITDSSGNGHTGALKGTGEPNYTASGKFGGAYIWDGSDDFIDTGTMGTMGSGLDTDGWTFVAYIKTTTTSGPMATMGTVNTGSATFIGILVNSSEVESSIEDVIALSMRDEDSQITRGRTTTASPVDITDGTFHHIVHQFNITLNTMLFYKDGIAKTAVNPLYNADNTADFGYGLYLGARNVRGTAGFLFNGTLDEIAIFDRTLDSTEINDIMDNGLAGAVVTAERRIIIISKEKI